MIQYQAIKYNKKIMRSDVELLNIVNKKLDTEYADFKTSYKGVSIFCNIFINTPEIKSPVWWNKEYLASEIKKGNGVLIKDKLKGEQNGFVSWWDGVSVTNNIETQGIHLTPEEIVHIFKSSTIDFSGEYNTYYSFLWNFMDTDLNKFGITQSNSDLLADLYISGCVTQADLDEYATTLKSIIAGNPSETKWQQVYNDIIKLPAMAEQKILLQDIKKPKTNKSKTSI